MLGLSWNACRAISVHYEVIYQIVRGRVHKKHAALRPFCEVSVNLKHHDNTTRTSWCSIQAE